MSSSYSSARVGPPPLEHCLQQYCVFVLSVLLLHDRSPHHNPCIQGKFTIRISARLPRPRCSSTSPRTRPGTLRRRPGMNQTPKAIRLHEFSTALRGGCPHAVYLHNEPRLASRKQSLSCGPLSTSCTLGACVLLRLGNFRVAANRCSPLDF